ncbi:PHD finger family protein [Striga asiatica]|uniref:PHD finger family protein n=1 Tax=Striga asiatica TaxID=4170 RepID=A0A5A7PYE1_STRAF|nr:PHD finger family protein [Striga asiatica]
MFCTLLWPFMLLVQLLVFSWCVRCGLISDGFLTLLACFCSRRVCFCELGFPGKLRGEKGKEDFLEEVARVEQFLSDPWLIKARENATIQVRVPKVVAPPTPVQPQPAHEEALAASAQVKRAALQKQAAAVSVVAEDYAKKFESGDLMISVKDGSGEEQGQVTAKVLCRLCFSGEYDGSEMARKMLPCNTCGKKYHRNCLKAWSQNRDLFHWSSWTCSSCRMCEVCRKTGDPNKFMFCKRCDGAYHCYCQQPPHKNVGHGPYLCPKHTNCHSCGSAVPGNGLSVRWFLGYTCCDACGRLFVKGNYCPVCLKVYRDSESTPMVCCDICQKWVHCPCDGISYGTKAVETRKIISDSLLGVIISIEGQQKDKRICCTLPFVAFVDASSSGCNLDCNDCWGIVFSDAKYMQFQVDRNLQYVCPTCRGECSQVRNLEEAVQELWRRRDEADKDLIASLREAAGLPTHEEIFDISPFSDDEESGPVMKSDSRSLKLSLKGLGDKSPKKGKESGKKSSKKKYNKKKGNDESLTGGGEILQSLSGHANVPTGQKAGGDKNEEKIQFSGARAMLSPIAGSSTENISVGNEAVASKHKYNDEVTASNVSKGSRAIKIKSNRSQDPTNREETGVSDGVLKTAQGPKLVIHLGARSRSAASLPRSDSKKRTELTSVKGHKTDHPDKVKGSKLIKLKNPNSELPNTSLKLAGGKVDDGYESVSPKTTYSLLGTEVPVSKRSKHSSTKNGDDMSGDVLASSRDRKPSLKFKIPKNTNNGNQSVSGNLGTGNQTSLSLHGKDDITYTRGQRSKRRRIGEEDGGSQWHEDNTMKEFTDANWVLQKLGKDAAGKRVEIHQPSNNSWGTVIEVSEGTSAVSIALDDGKSKIFELGKQDLTLESKSIVKINAKLKRIA